MGFYEEFALNKALEETWLYINSVNRYLANNEPWQLAKDESKKGRLGRVLYQASAALRTITYFIYPIMPGSADKIWNYLGEEHSLSDLAYSELDYYQFTTDRRTKLPKPLFPRVDLKEFLHEQEQKSSPAKPTNKEKKMDVINFEDFQKMDLRVAKIIEAERVEGTNKLIKCIIDIGDENRQMISGIADTYSPEDLIGKKLIVIVNLKPAVIRGIESQAMLLAGIREDNSAVIPFFTEEVPTGAKVK